MSGFDIDVVLRREVRGGTPFHLDAKFSTPRGITVVCGPSGAGKSSLLHAILGALAPESGRIAVGGRTLFDAAADVNLPIRRRGVGMVFQDALLFPHLTALENVAFGVGGRDARRTAAQYLERALAADLADRRPAQLSGGQRQRVALARALAAGPRALLLDEPFSALDAGAREALGTLLLELHAASGIPFLHVTHDLGEAVRLGDRLVLIDEGRVQQVGPPSVVVAAPASLAAARAVGTENRFAGRVVAHRPEQGCSEVDLGGTRVLVSLLAVAAGADVTLGLRAEDILLSLEPLSRTSARNLLPATIQSIAPRGVSVELRVTTPVAMRVLVTPAAVGELALEPGKPVYLLIKAAAFQRLV